MISAVQEGGPDVVTSKKLEVELVEFSGFIAAA